MVCVNELTARGCHSRAVLEPLVILLAPFAPHIAEELWHSALGHDTTVNDATWPVHDERHLVEASVTMAVSFNGKPRYNITVPTGTPADQVQQIALAHEGAARWTEGKTIAKVIVVPGKIVNIVVK